MSSAFTPAGFSSDNPKGLATAIWTYLGDVNHEEPLMLNLYAKTIPELDRACVINAARKMPTTIPSAAPISDVTMLS